MNYYIFFLELSPCTLLYCVAIKLFNYKHQDQGYFHFIKENNKKIIKFSMIQMEKPKSVTLCKRERTITLICIELRIVIYWSMSTHLPFFTLYIFSNDFVQKLHNKSNFFLDSLKSGLALFLISLADNLLDSG